MKKKILLKFKKLIVRLRKVYKSQKEVIIDFLKSDLSDYLENDNCQKQMKILNVHDEVELKLKTLKIYEDYFTVEEHQKWYDYITQMAQNKAKRKLIQ